MSARQAGPCPKAMTPATYAKEQRARIFRREDQHPQIWNHRAPSFSFWQEQRPARSCSTAPVRVAAVALWVWNETDMRWHRHPADDKTRAGSPCHALRAQRTRNDSRSRTRNRSRLRRPRSACSLSSRTSNRSRAENLKHFLPRD